MAARWGIAQLEVTRYSYSCPGIPMAARWALPSLEVARYSYRCPGIFMAARWVARPRSCLVFPWLPRYSYGCQVVIGPDRGPLCDLACWLAGWLASWLAGWVPGWLAMARWLAGPEVNKINPRSMDLPDFLALAPEVDKISPRSVDSMTSWPWLLRSTKSISEVSIW